MPSGFVTGQAPAEAGIGQSQCNTPLQAFADFGGGIQAGNGNLGYGNGSSGAVLGSSGNEVERRQAAYSGGVPPQAPSVPGYYAPFAGSSQNASFNVAMRVLTLLKAHPNDSIPWWGSMFWQAIHSMHQAGQLDQTVLSMLIHFGYLDQGCQSTPRAGELTEALNRLVQVPASPARVDGVASTGAVASLSIASAHALNWNAQLPPHFKRAAFEIFQEIRAHGTLAVRDWLSANFAGSRTSDQW